MSVAVNRHSRMFVLLAAIAASTIFAVGGCCPMCKVSTKVGENKWLEMDRFASRVRAEECGSTYYYAIGTPLPDQFPKDSSLFVGTDRSCCFYMVARPNGVDAVVAIRQYGLKLDEDFYTIYYSPNASIIPGMETLISAGGEVWTFYYRKSPAGLIRVHPPNLPEDNPGGKYHLSIIYPRNAGFSEGAQVPVMVEREFGEVIRKTIADYKLDHPTATQPVGSNPTSAPVKK